MKIILSLIACMLALPAWSQIISSFPGKYTIGSNDVFLLSTPGVATYKTTFGTLVSNLNGLITVTATVTNAVARGSNLALTNATSFGVFYQVSGLTNMEFFSLKQGTNLVIFRDGSNIVINATSTGGGGGAGSFPASSGQFTTNTTLTIIDGASTTNQVLKGVTQVDGIITVAGTNINAFYGSNYFGGLVQIAVGSPGIGKVLTSIDANGNAWWSNSVGSGLLITNANQFGASTTLTLKDGTLLTNVNNLGTTTASNLNVAGTAAASVFNVSTGNMAFINLTNKLGPAQVALGIQQLTNVSASSPASGDVLSYNAATRLWTSGQSVGGGIDVVSNINVTAVANVLLDLAAANVFKLSLKTNLTYTFTNQDALTRIGRVHFQQDTIGARSTTHGIAGGVLQTNALENLQATTNANALSILDLTPGFWITNLAVTWFGTNMQPTVSLTAPVSFADTFDRVAANPLDATSSSGGTWSLGPGAFAPIQGSFNAAHGTDGSDPAYSGARVLSPSFSANQSASVTLGQTGAELLLVGPCVRMESTTVANCYAAWAESATIIRVFKLTDGLSEGSFTQVQLGSDYPVASLVTGDVIKLTVTGSSTTTLTLYVNNIAQGSPINDSSAPFTTGQPGIFLYDTVHFATAFSADDL